MMAHCKAVKDHHTHWHSVSDGARGSLAGGQCCGKAGCTRVDDHHHPDVIDDAVDVACELFLALIDDYITSHRQIAQIAPCSDIFNDESCALEWMTYSQLQDYARTVTYASGR